MYSDSTTVLPLGMNMLALPFLKMAAGLAVTS